TMQWAIQLSVSLVSVLLLACSSGEDMIDADRKTFVLSETMLAAIQLDTARERQVQGVLNLNGKIVADEGRTVELFPIVGGNVLSCNVELGDYVERNQILVVIRSSEVAEYDRQLTDARSEVSVAEKNLSIKQDLFESKLVSEREVLEARKELDKARAELRRVEETFSIYGFSGSSEYLIRSPISGFVVNKKINRDMTLPSGHNESVFTIAELSEVWAVANVYETDIALVDEGMDVTVSTISYPGERISGRIDKIFNVLDPQTKTMRVRVRINNEDFKLKPEMIATTRVQYKEARTLPAVPASALIFDRSRSFVVVFHDRLNIEIREVEVYKATDEIAWIKMGLQPGEVAVSGNQLFIYDALTD